MQLWRGWGLRVVQSWKSPGGWQGPLHQIATLHHSGRAAIGKGQACIFYFQNWSFFQAGLRSTQKKHLFSFLLKYNKLDSSQGLLPGIRESAAKGTFPRSVTKKGLLHSHRDSIGASAGRRTLCPIPTKQVLVYLFIKHWWSVQYSLYYTRHWGNQSVFWRQQTLTNNCTSDSTIKNADGASKKGRPLIWSGSLLWWREIRGSILGKQAKGWEEGQQAERPHGVRNKVVCPRSRAVLDEEWQRMV